jgi:sorbitol-specific phosphotransferase system component IIC
MLVAAFVLAVLTHASTWWVYLFVKTGSIYNDYMLAIVLSIVSLVAIFWDTKKVQSQK